MGDEEPSRRVCPPATPHTGPRLPQQLTPGPLPPSWPQSCGPWEVLLLPSLVQLPSCPASPSLPSCPHLSIPSTGCPSSWMPRRHLCPTRITLNRSPAAPGVTAAPPTHTHTGPLTSCPRLPLLHPPALQVQPYSGLTGPHFHPPWPESMWV